MAIRKRLKEGFTLVELMIVVAIVGVLAVLAVYGVRKYIANAKTAEAKNSLGQIGKDAVTAYEGEKMSSSVLTTGTATGVLRDVCLSAVAKIPTVPPSAAKYQSSKADWSPAADVSANAGFPCLRYEMTAPQYYSYGYSAATGATFNATAEGNLNGDAQTSLFSQGGAVKEGRLLVAPSILEVSPEE
jgi:type IV pilus assembly protein PilA